MGGLGLAAVTELAVTRDLKLVELSPAELDRLGRQFPSYTGYEIPPGTYNKIDYPVQALGIWSAVVVHESMPHQLAYELTCTIYKYRDDLLKISPVVQDMTIANLNKVPGVPLHPGAQQFADPADAKLS